MDATEESTRPLVPMDSVTRLAEPVFDRGDGLPVGEFKKSWATARKNANRPGRLFHGVNWRNLAEVLFIDDSLYSFVTLLRCIKTYQGSRVIVHL